jgi:hypothetical protein
VLVGLASVINFEVGRIGNAGEDREVFEAEDLEVRHVSIVDEEKDADQIAAGISAGGANRNAVEHLGRRQALVRFKGERRAPTIAGRASGPHCLRLSNKLVPTGKRLRQHELDELPFFVGQVARGHAARLARPGFDLVMLSIRKATVALASVAVDRRQPEVCEAAASSVGCRAKVDTE